MQIVEFNIPAAAWKGLNTKYPADTKFVDVDEFTSGSFNFTTDTKGVINKRPGVLTYASTLTGAAKDQYEVVFDNGTRHELIMSSDDLQYTTGDGIFNVAASGYTAASYWEFATFKNRVYFGNGVDDPQVYDITASYGGVTYTPPQVKDMGAQVPTAPSAGTPTSGGSVPTGAHTYKVTYEYYSTTESNGSATSGVSTIVANHTVPVTIPVGGYGVTARNIYRDDNDGLYTLVGSVENNTATTFSDTVALGTTPIPDDNDLPPTFSLIVQFRDRVWVAGVSDSQNVLYYSEPGTPDVFHVNNRISCSSKDAISGLLVYNDRIIVFNKSSMGQILGTTSTDFRYSEISNSVGCTDNRSVQIRTINGVPIVIWLAQLDVYTYNGSQLSVASELITDQLQLNIQQALNTKGKNIQTTQADFQAGTATPGITLLLDPGTITTVGYSGTTNPEKLWDTTAEWDAGSSLTNVATAQADNSMGVPLTFAPTMASGTLSNLVLSGSNLAMTVASPANSQGAGYGGAVTPRYRTAPSLSVTRLAQSFIPDRSGTITSIGAQVLLFPGTSRSSNCSIYSDSAASPGSSLYSFLPSQLTNGAHQSASWSGSYHVTAGTRYWFVYEATDSDPNGYLQVGKSAGGDTYNTGVVTAKGRNPAGGHPNFWDDLVDSTGAALPVLASNISFTLDPIAKTGTWVSPVYDSLSVAAVATALSQTATLPTGTSYTTKVETASNDLMTTNYTSSTQSNVNGTVSLSMTNRRFWRVTVTASTTDDRVSPTIAPLTISYSNTATWVSEVVDHTADILTLDALTLSSVTPLGTTATMTIATSADNITYSAFTALGSAVARRYSKVRVDLTGTGTTTPTVTSILFRWSVRATFTSSAIDTINTPAGWGIFQSTFDTNGGTATFKIRSAATQGGLAAAIYSTVTNGQIIPVALLRWVQWQVILTSSANAVPEVNSAVVNWLITSQLGVRVASLFYNKNYYLSAATYNSPTNNIVFVYDQSGTWKVFQDITASTIGLFFGEPYYGEATGTSLVKWLDSSLTTDNGQDIEMDVRTKAYGDEIGDSSKTKMLRSLIMKVMGTGARVTPSYSVDGGTTFLGMANVDTGSAYYDTPTDGKLHFIRFVPASAQTQWDYTIQIQLYNDDEFPVEIHALRARVFLSERPVR